MGGCLVKERMQCSGTGEVIRCFLSLEELGGEMNTAKEWSCKDNGVVWSSYLNEHHWVLKSTVFKEKEVGLLSYGNS